MSLTDGIFENGEYEVPSKSQNQTVLGQGGPSSTQWSHPSWTSHWHHLFGTNCYPQFGHSTQTKYLFPHFFIS